MASEGRLAHYHYFLTCRTCRRAWIFALKPLARAQLLAVVRRLHHHHFHRRTRRCQPQTCHPAPFYAARRPPEAHIFASCYTSRTAGFWSHRRYHHRRWRRPLIAALVSGAARVGQAQFQLQLFLEGQAWALQGHLSRLSEPLLPSTRPNHGKTQRTPLLCSGRCHLEQGGARLPPRPILLYLHKSPQTLFACSTHCCLVPIGALDLDLKMPCS